METDPARSPGLSESTDSGDATTISLAALRAAQAADEMQEPFEPLPLTLRPAPVTSPFDVSRSTRQHTEVNRPVESSSNDSPDDDSTESTAAVRNDDRAAKAGAPAATATADSEIAQSSAGPVHDSLNNDPLSLPTVSLAYIRRDDLAASGDAPEPTTSDSGLSASTDVELETEAIDAISDAYWRAMEEQAFPVDA